eukprot:TRINITY_DN19_c0_g1_i2.p1 TRINITY_DN19_c0_g1~~TRINITY_DN19_c0_g1_i2.p1  ORF type:complete len:250 (-),score=77.71 TRINITY_DN19_c0_g1_i2:345-1094(-)
MMKLCAMMVLLVVLATAHQTSYVDLAGEIEAPPGELSDAVSMVQEGAGEDDSAAGDIVYRISYNTRYEANSGSSVASKGDFKIKIWGDGSPSDTGTLFLVTHPGYSCKAAQAAECFADIKGVVKATDSTKCNCDPSKSGYSESAAQWEPLTGRVQHTYVSAPNVGQITKVEVTTTSSDSWVPEFIKVNTNSIETGNGNGIYYMDVNKAINSGATFTATTTATDSNGVQVNMDDKASHRYGIVKCENAVC